MCRALASSPVGDLRRMRLLHSRRPRRGRSLHLLAALSTVLPCTVQAGLFIHEEACCDMMGAKPDLQSSANLISNSKSAALSQLLEHWTPCLVPEAACEELVMGGYGSEEETSTRRCAP